MFWFSMLLLNELVKTKQNVLFLKVLSCWTLTWEKHLLEVQKNIVWQKKKELGELVEKCKKEYDKEVKAICHFSMQKMSTRSN